MDVAEVSVAEAPLATFIVPCLTATSEITIRQINNRRKPIETTTVRRYGNNTTQYLPTIS